MLWLSFTFFLLVTADSHKSTKNTFLLTDWEQQFSFVSENEIEYGKEKTKEMFYFGWRNYLEHAFPEDELDPIHCTGRGADHLKPDNININDVLGDYSLTLIDTLDTLVVFGDTEQFKKAVNLVINTVSFEKNTTVQVFEATIRVVGGLLSAHLIASDTSQTYGNFTIDGYDNELLELAQDLVDRLLPAFEGTATGLPFTRVNLQKGVLPDTVNLTCTAGAGSLLLEFGILSRMLGDDTYENIARGINRKLWELRDANTGLLGNLLDIQTGQWVGHLSGLGAGLDSFYEYLLKTYIMFGESEDLKMFEEIMQKVFDHMRRGRKSCFSLDGEPPLFVNVDARDGTTANTWIDSLQASFSGLLVLAGHVSEAVCHHAFYYAIWKKFGVLPERYNWQTRQPDVNFYPLRPEFAESTYFLYSATKNPFYLRVGLEILESLDSITRVSCGFATVHDVLDGSLEDRMESFFLAETMKYLYLLFDLKNPINLNQDKIVFSTEGHIYPISPTFRSPSFREFEGGRSSANMSNSRGKTCESMPNLMSGTPPLLHQHMKQIFEVVGLSSSL